MMNWRQVNRRFPIQKDNFSILCRLSPKLKTPRPLTKKDLYALIRTSGWLTDNIILFFFFIVLEERQLWMKAQTPSPSTPTSWAFITSHLISSLLNVHDKDMNKRWICGSRNISIWYKTTNYNKLYGLLIPIHVGDNHWSLLKVEFDNKTITYIDSLVKNNISKGQEIIKAFIYHHQERLLKFPSLTREIQQNEWKTIVFTPQKVTQQQNGHDCGVFCCMYADFSMLNLPLTVDHTLATQYRVMMFNYIAAYVTDGGPE